MAGRPTVPRPSLAPSVGGPHRQTYATHQEPLEDRIDAAGIRQREDPEAAKALRAEAFARGAEDAVGWWRHLGADEWVYYGDGTEPIRSPQ